MGRGVTQILILASPIEFLTLLMLLHMDVELGVPALIVAVLSAIFFSDCLVEDVLRGQTSCFLLPHPGLLSGPSLCTVIPGEWDFLNFSW